MKKLVSALLTVCCMLLLPLYVHADIPALPRETTPGASPLTIVLIVAVVLIVAAILIGFLRKRKDK